MPRQKIRLPAAITETVEYALSIILSRPSINIRNLAPETQLSMGVADAFRGHVLKGRYCGIFTHVANEGKRSRLMGAILRAMGMIPGTSDFIFAWHANDKIQVAFIELKQPRKPQNDNQKYFATWCEHSRLTYAIAHSVDEVEGIIRAMGGLL